MTAGSRATRCIERAEHGAVRVSGPDATSFLQSLVSQDLDVLGDGCGTHSLLLSPQGKLEVDFRALCVGDDWWLDCDAGFGAVLAERLGRYRIRVNADVNDRSAAWDLLEVRGPDAPARVAAATGVDVPDPTHAHVPWRECRIVRSDWATMAGVDVIGPSDEIRVVRDAMLAAGVEPYPPGAYEVARIEAGIARLGVDIDERTIPQEAFLERDAVSFTKGCFLGQELVCRIDTRGHVNRFLRRVDLRGMTVPDVGATVGLDGRDIGTLTSIAPVPDEARSVALAMIRREVEPPADVVVHDEHGDLPARIAMLP